jgi:hypothetical protein
LKNKISQA